MIAQGNSHYPNLTGIARQTLQQFATLLSNLNDSGKMLQSLDGIRELLQCMVLGTAEYDVAISRINNAHRYLESEEPGAAKYELRLLIGGLQSQLAVDGEYSGSARPAALATAAE